MKTNNVLHAIAALNLEPIKNKLMDAESGEGWSQAKVEAMEIEYRRFLHLMHVFPNEAASPTKAVDTFWHYHILDTQKYAADCDDVFGCFMHHNPYGDQLRAPGGVASGDRMQQLYEATFGEAYIRAEAYCVDLPAGSDKPAAQTGAEPGVCIARCHSFCMMQAKGAGAQAAKQQARTPAFCMATPTGTEDAAGDNLHMRQHTPAAAASFA